MAETKATNGVSGNKKPVKKERVSKLENYTDIVEVVAVEFTPNDRMNEKTAVSEGATGSGSEGATEGKKAPNMNENLIIGATGVINSNVLEGPVASASLKSTSKEKAKAEKDEQEQEQDQEKE